MSEWTYYWNDEKNETIIRERGVSFEIARYFIENGGLLDIQDHPNQARYPGQQIFIVNINGYAYRVPFVESGNQRFLKTIILSRRATRECLRSSNDEN